MVSEVYLTRVTFIESDISVSQSQVNQGHKVTDFSSPRNVLLLTYVPNTGKFSL